MSKTEQTKLSDKMAQLDELLRWFESDDFDIEIALEKFSEAKEVADAIEHDLLEMKNTITVLSERFDVDKE